jgi:hypothetical protein
VCRGIDCFQKFCAQKEIGLEHWIGSYLIRERLGISSLKEGAVGAVGEKQPPEFRNSRASQLDPSEKEGTVIPIRLLGMFILKEGAM